MKKAGALNDIEIKPAVAGLTTREILENRNEEKYIVTLHLDLITPDPNQPRKFFHPKALAALAQSILKNGLLQAILVRPSEGRYIIVHGERRYRASKLAGLQTIDCVVKQLSLEQVKDLQLIENLDRNNLLPIELAFEFQKRVDAGQTQEKIAAAIGKSRGFVEQRLALLRLPAAAQALLKEGKLSFRRARNLLTISAGNQIESAARPQLPCDARSGNTMDKNKFQEATFASKSPSDGGRTDTTC